FVGELAHRDVTACVVATLRLERRLLVEPFLFPQADKLVEAVLAATEGMLAHLVGFDAQLPLLDRGVKLRPVSGGHRQHDFRHLEMLPVPAAAREFGCDQRLPHYRRVPGSSVALESGHRTRAPTKPPVDALVVKAW